MRGQRPDPRRAVSTVLRGSTCARTASKKLVVCQGRDGQVTGEVWRDRQRIGFWFVGLWTGLSKMSRYITGTRRRPSATPPRAPAGRPGCRTPPRRCARSGGTECGVVCRARVGQAERPGHRVAVPVCSNIQFQASLEYSTYTFRPGARLSRSTWRTCARSRRTRGAACRTSRPRGSVAQPHHPERRTCPCWKSDRPGSTMSRASCPPM